jgi:prepilin-type N-terminal cleavage/methylation domain-containing protein
MSKQKNTAFTLVELLVVISIIGILSSIGSGAFGQIRNNAKKARAQQELNQIARAIDTAKQESGKLLFDMSGNVNPSGYTASRYSADFSRSTNCLSEIGNTRDDWIACQAEWINILNSIANHTNGAFDNLSMFGTDPWGRPYLIDENEGVNNTLCFADIVMSTGPNGEHDGVDDIYGTIPFLSEGKTFSFYLINTSGSGQGVTWLFDCICGAVNSTCQQVTP